MGAPAERGPRGGTILSDAVGLPAGSDQGVALSCPSDAAVLGCDDFPRCLLHELGMQKLGALSEVVALPWALSQAPA